MKGSLVHSLCCAIIYACLGILSINQPAACGGTLDLQPVAPDIYAGFVTTSYTPSSGSTGTFSATGWAPSFKYSGTNTVDISGTNSYDLNVVLNKNTGQLISGSLAINGIIPTLGASSGTLLTGTVTQFGYMPGGGDVFEFLCKPTGGALLSYFKGEIGVELSTVPSGFTGSFLTGFTTSGLDQSDNFNYVAVPEPTSSCLLASALGCGLAAAMRRRWRRLGSRS